MAKNLYVGHSNHRNTEQKNSSVYTFVSIIQKNNREWKSKYPEMSESLVKNSTFSTRKCYYALGLCHLRGRHGAVEQEVGIDIKKENRGR